MSNDDPLLTAALRGIADEDAHAGASDVVASRLRAEVRALGAATRRQRSFARLAAAAALIAAIAIPGWRLSRRSAVPTHAGDVAKAVEIATDFMPLTYSDVPTSGGQIVRLEVPRQTLSSFGLTPPEAVQSADTVLADVFVGDDGLARAVRFVRSSP